MAGVTKHKEFFAMAELAEHNKRQLAAVLLCLLMHGENMLCNVKSGSFAAQHEDSAAVYCGSRLHRHREQGARVLSKYLL